LSILRNSVENIQALLKSDKIKGTLRANQNTFFIISLSVLLRMKNISRKIVGKLETYFVLNNFFFENLTFYGIMWKIVVEQGGPQMTIWGMPFACWIPKAKNTQIV
jgi:hypothetical protein